MEVDLNVGPSAPAPVIEERLRARSRRANVIAVSLGAAALVVALATAAGVSYVAVQNNRQGRILVDCTTPGPTIPTAANPATGNECYDRGRRQTGEAVVVIVDQVDQRICRRMEAALATALNRDVRLTCQVPPATTTPAGPPAGAAEVAPTTTSTP